MIELLRIFGNNILPIFLAASAGYLLSRGLKVPPRPISQVAFYIFSPSLIFQLLTQNDINGNEALAMVAFTIVSALAIGAIAWAAGRLLRLDRRTLVAVIITAMFGNAGNYGLSLNLFAFGEQALAYASLYFVTLAVLIYSVGVIIASMGRTSLRQALLGLFKVPAIYALAAAGAFNLFGWEIPTAIGRTVDILAGAAIPMLMVLLGIQLQHARWAGKLKALILSNGLRLIAAPALAFALSIPFELSGAARQAGIAEAAMPTAVVMTVLATEYNVEPSFVTMTVFLSTILSPITVTPILAILGA